MLNKKCFKIMNICVCLTNQFLIISKVTIQTRKIKFSANILCKKIINLFPIPNVEFSLKKIKSRSLNTEKYPKCVNSLYLNKILTV